MSFVVLVNIHVKEEHIKDAQPYFKELSIDFSNESDCSYCQVQQSIDTPSLFVFYEIWSIKFR